MNRLKRHTPSPAMIVAAIALFVALGGAAYAGVTLSNNTVRSNHIVNGQVKTVDLANLSVSNAKLRNNAVNSAKIKDNSVSSADVQDATILTADLADGAVTGAKVLNGSVATADLAPGTIPPPGFTTVLAREQVFASVGNNLFQVRSVQCAAGEKVIGGGGVFTPVGTRALSPTELGTQYLFSVPVDSAGDALTDGASPTGWLTSAQNVSGATRDFHVYALCAKP